jgi:pimeloyl-ACP methyl ester carboxylesterase
MRIAPLGLALAAALGTIPDAAAARLGSIDFTPCTLEATGLPMSVVAQCGTLEVPEDPAAPDGRRITLALAWIPASGEAQPDPVVMIAGGPGQSALETYPAASAAFADVRKNRHVLLVDQRGTGGSNRLACEDGEAEGMFADAAAPTVEEAAAVAMRCRDQLSAHADLRLYTTGVAIQDLEAVRLAVGAPSLNLVGISYGTRVAQQYAARYPASTRSLVLDGVAPNDLVLGSEFALRLEDSLRLQFARCSEDATCRGRFGDPRETLARVLAMAEAGQTVVRYRDPVTAEAREETLTRGHVAMLARMYAYQPMVLSTLPLALHEAAEGRPEALMAQARMITGQLGASIVFGMQLSVVCAEDAPELVPDPAAEGTVLGNDFARFTAAQCAVWPAGERAADFRAPLATDVPALLFSGEFDPVTPPSYGERVAASLPNGRHLVLRGQGHNVFGAGCAPTLMARFIETTDAAALDAGCLDQLVYTPPFTGFHGWEP